MQSMSMAGAFRMIVATTAEAAEVVFGRSYVTSPRVTLSGSPIDSSVPSNSSLHRPEPTMDANGNATR